MEKALNVLDAQEMLFKESAALKEYLKSRDYEESDVKECIEKYIAENVHALCKVRKGMSFPMLLEFLIETYKADKDVRNLKNLWLIAERPSQQEKLYLAVESLEHEIAYGKNKYGACPE